MQLVKPESSSHWYSLENGVWSPCYQLPKKNGDGMKAVTLREARELGLYPSVTSILDVIRKPGIEAWKQSELIWSALTICRNPNESDEDFVRRVVEEAEQRSTQAKEFGSQVHAAAEAFFANQPIDEAVKPYVEQFVAWAKDQVTLVLGSELPCGCPECGYAGRLDLLCTVKDFGFSVVDFKTQKVKKNKDGVKQPAFYSEWPRQLAAYAHSFVQHSTSNVLPKMVSVVIDSSEPGPVYVKQWDNFEQHFKMFRYCIELWCDDRGYKPGAKA